MKHNEGEKKHNNGSLRPDLCEVSPEKKIKGMFMFLVEQER